jgi:hypothetical protein
VHYHQAYTQGFVYTTHPPKNNYDPVAVAYNL